MKLDQLTYFLETAKHEHLGRAAKTLSLSRSAVSHAISQLEEELGHDLFVKRGKYIALTNHGKLLKERATRLLREVEFLREEVSAEDVQLTGHYRLAASHLLCSKYLVPAWADFQRTHARLTCELFTLRSSQVIAGVLNREIDLGLCFNPQPHPDLQISKLREGQLLVTVCKNHPILHLSRVKRIQALSEFPCVLPKAFQGVEICERHPMFEKFQIKTRPDCLIDNYESMIEKVANSQSWGFLPDWLIRENRTRLCALNFPGWDAVYQVSAIWHHDRFLGKALTHFIHTIASKISELR